MNATRDVPSILTFIVERIDAIYETPLAFGNASECVEIVLHYYHELWAEILGRFDAYDSIRQEVHELAHCKTTLFSTRYRLKHPHCSEREVANYAVGEWKKISTRLGL